ncbi:MAG: retroviral-like aspartic protease family protein [Magnetococcales bacterium]|nr:retroviral-like aspartic protease family protein [Magnetococcales bacterium]
MAVFFLWGSVPAHGGIYQWQDANGKWHFSDTKPPEPSQKVNLPTTTTSTREIPLTQDGRGDLFWLEAKLNGVKTFPFILDTGANIMIMPQGYYDELLKKGAIGPGDDMGVVTSTLADGSTTQSPKVHLKSVTIGGLTVHNVTAAVGTTRTLPLLGTSVLSLYDHWRIDQKKQRLVLTGPTAASARTTRAKSDAVAANCLLKRSTLDRLYDDLNSYIEDEKVEKNQVNARIAQFNSRREAYQAVYNRKNKSNTLIKRLRREYEELSQESAEIKSELKAYDARSLRRKNRFDLEVLDLKNKTAAYNKTCPRLAYRHTSGKWDVFPQLSGPKIVE